jgi:hypothetical protein
MDDLPTPASLFCVGLVGMLLLAVGVALDGGEFADVAEVPALMGAWAVAVVLIDRWVVRRH